MPEHARMSTHRRFHGPRLARDPNHHTEPRQPADTYTPDDLPSTVDLRPHCPPVVDQGHTESCTANALAGAYGYLEGRIAGKQVPISRLFIFYNDRMLEDRVAADGGAMICDGVKGLKRYGACEETTWPFDPSQVKQKPHARAYDEGQGHEVDQAATVAVDLHAMRHCLAEGYPFVFGLEIDDFEPDTRGFVKRPTSKKDLGGHAMCCVGYIDAQKVFIVRNSWGTRWGDQGYCYVPYDWMTDPDACSDLWTLRRAHDLDFSMVGGNDEEAGDKGAEADDSNDKGDDGGDGDGDHDEGAEDNASANEGNASANEGDASANEGDASANEEDA